MYKCDTGVKRVKRQLHKMVKHTQTIRRLFTDELFQFDHFVGLALKGLKLIACIYTKNHDQLHNCNSERDASLGLKTLIIYSQSNNCSLFMYRYLYFTNL